MVLTLAAYSSLEEEVKKSRFICHAVPIASTDEAMAFLDEVKDPAARHNCWAYLIGKEYRFSDDGEPSGSAGKRILAAIEQQGLDGVMVVVVRWFGGIKLGVGGLSRAYGGCASRCLQDAEKRQVIPMGKVEFEVPFDFIGQLNFLLQSFEASKLNEECRQEGIVITVELAEYSCNAFVKQLIDSSRGRVRVINSPKVAGL